MDEETSDDLIGFLQKERSGSVDLIKNVLILSENIEKDDSLSIKCDNDRVLFTWMFCGVERTIVLKSDVLTAYIDGELEGFHFYSRKLPTIEYSEDFDITRNVIASIFNDIINKLG